METYFDYLSKDVLALIQKYVGFKDLDNWCRIIKYCNDKIYWQLFYSMLSPDWKLIIDNKPENINYLQQYKRLYSLSEYRGLSRSKIYYTNYNLDEIIYMISMKIRDVNKKDSDGITFLIKAIKSQDLPLIKYLVLHNTNLEQLILDQGDLRSPLMIAAAIGNFEIFKYLLDHGGKITNINNSEIRSAIRGGNLEIIKLIISVNSPVSQEYLGELLEIASGEDKIPIIEYLLSIGADINYRNFYGSTILINASIDGHLDQVKFLMDHGADPNIRSNDI